MYPLDSGCPTWVSSKYHPNSNGTSLVAQMVKNLPAIQKTWIKSPGWGNPLEEGMATQSSILAWRIHWMEEPGGLQSVGSQRVGHNWNDLTWMHASSVTAIVWYYWWFLVLKCLWKLMDLSTSMDLWRRVQFLQHYYFSPCFILLLSGSNYDFVFLACYMKIQFS